MKSSCGNHHRPAGISNIASILVTAPGLIGCPSGKRHIPTQHPETEVTRSTSKLPRHTAIASCQAKQSTKMSVLSHRQIRHPARRRTLLSHPRRLPLHLRRLPSHRRQLLLTLQSPRLFPQRFLPSRRFRHHRRRCGLRKWYGSISPLPSSSRGWLLSYTSNGNLKR